MYVTELNEAGHIVRRPMRAPKIGAGSNRVEITTRADRMIEQARRQRLTSGIWHVGTGDSPAWHYDVLTRTLTPVADPRPIATWSAGVVTVDQGDASATVDFDIGDTGYSGRRMVVFSDGNSEIPIRLQFAAGVAVLSVNSQNAGAVTLRACVDYQFAAPLVVRVRAVELIFGRR